MRNIFLILFLLAAGVFTTKSSAQAVILRADTLEVPCLSTDTFLVPVYLDNFSNVAGLQFTFRWDTLWLDYAYVTELHPQFLGAGFDTSAATLALGKLTFAWTDLAGLNLPSNTVLFKVAFSRIGGPQTPLEFFNDTLGTSIFVFDNVGNELPYQTQHGAVKPIDDIGPTITCPTSVVDGSSGPKAILNIEPLLADNCGIPAAGWSSVGATVANFPNDPDASGALFNIGFSTVTYKTTDAGGNTATCSFDILLEFSVTTTDLTLIANPNNLASCGETVTIDVLAFNFDSIAGFQFTMGWLPAALEFVSISNTNAALNIGVPNFNLDSTGVGYFTFVWASPDPNGAALPVGDVLFRLTYNVLGAATLDFIDLPTETLAFIAPSFDETTLITFGATISVIDTLPPSITCPIDITVQAPGTTPVQGIAPVSVNDNCAVTLVGWSVSGATNGSFPSDGDASGALFNLGSSTVTYLTTDAGGNTASCSFNVTVEFANTSTDLTIIANSTNVACGGNFGVDFSVLNFTTISGFQFTVNWDPALYQFTSASNFNLPIGIGITNFGVDSAGLGYITFFWNGDINGVSANNGDILFRLNFNVLSNTPSSITFGDDPTARFAFDGGPPNDEIPMITIDGQISVVDNVPPTIVCPTPAPVDAIQGQLFATVNGLEPTTLTDNCGGIPDLTYVQTIATTNSGSGFANGDYNAGTTTVVYTATDANGNTATCSFQVIVNAGTPVVLQLDTVDLGCQGVPAQVTVNLTVENFNNIIGLQFGVEWDTSVIQLVPPVNLQYLLGGPNPIFINASGTLSFFGAEPSWPDVPDGDAILTLTFNVMNVNGLATTILSFFGPFDALDPNFQSIPVQTINGSFIFTLDNVPPVVTCPSDTILNAPALACDADFTPPSPTATDVCGTIGSITVLPAISVFPSGTPTTVTYTVTDNSGNSSTCSFNVTVLENNPPVASGCPIGPIVVNANGLCQGNASWTPPTFQDACGQALDTIFNDYDPGGLFAIDTTLVNYTSIDLSGNATTCSFEVIVRDMTAPTLTCPLDTVVTPVSGCSAIVHFVLVATDNCDVDVNILCSDTSGTLFTGVTPIICAALDESGNVANCSFVITVLDTIQPLFPNGCPMNINVVSASGNCGANPTWQIPSVSDNCAQNIAPMPSQASGTFFDVQNSPHTVIYTATDAFGNSATCSFTVTVADSTKPVLTNCPTLPIVKVLHVDSCTVTLFWTVPTVSDNCGAGSLTLTSNLSPGVFPTGDTTVIYTATDASGNVTTCFFNVSVKDIVQPWFLDCPTQPIVIPNGSPCGNPVNFPFPTGMDNCTPEPELVYTSSYMPGDSFIIGTTQFPVRVTDASGNFIECDITITIMGQVATFINIPTTILVADCDAHVSWVSPIPVGFCQPITIDSTHASGSVFPFGTTTVIYTATDTFTNVATASFNIIVSENVAPVFNCPISPIIVNIGGGIIADSSDFLIDTDTTAGCDGVELTFNTPTATDNCVTPTVTQTSPGLPSGSVFPVAITTLEFQAIDSSGNLSTCFVHIEVVALPELRPVVSPNPGCADSTLTITAANIQDAIYTWSGPVTSTTNVVTINGLSAQNEGLYTVVANVNGCLTAPDSVTVFLTKAPVAEHDLTYTLNPEETITFPSVLTNDVLVPAFHFDICNTSALPGLTMNLSDGTFTYTAGEVPKMVSFTYEVCSKTCGLSDNATVTITINDTKCVFIPNVITPNNDGENDWLDIRCIDSGLFRENSLVVYSQWGDKVFEASPYNNNEDEGWHGTLDGENGKDLPDGVYYYIFKPGPNIRPMKGFVEIFR